jgi:hypothetical protein
VLLNSTNELLTIEGVAAVRGEWGPPAPPKRGEVVEKQSSGRWVNQSSVEGVNGHLRLGSTKGYIEIAWNMPMHDVSRADHTITVPPALGYHLHINDENLEQIVLMMTLFKRP